MSAIFNLYSEFILGADPCYKMWDATNIPHVLRVDSTDTNRLYASLNSSTLSSLTLASGLCALRVYALYSKNRNILIGLGSLAATLLGVASVRAAILGIIVVLLLTVLACSILWSRLTAATHCSIGRELLYALMHWLPAARHVSAPIAAGMCVKT